MRSTSNATATSSSRWRPRHRANCRRSCSSSSISADASTTLCTTPGRCCREPSNTSRPDDHRARQRDAQNARSGFNKGKGQSGRRQGPPLSSTGRTHDHLRALHALPPAAQIARTRHLQKVPADRQGGYHRQGPPPRAEPARHGASATRAVSSPVVQTKAPVRETAFDGRGAPTACSFHTCRARGETMPTRIEQLI